MTDFVNPSLNRPADAFETAGAISYGGTGGAGFYVDGADPTELATQNANIDDSQFNTFDETSSSSSLDVTIDPGEAFIYGAWLATDQSTTVTLPTNSTTFVYVGWDKTEPNTVIVGKESAFSNASSDTDFRLEAWQFQTDGSGVTNVADARPIGYTQFIQGSSFYGNIPQPEFEVAYSSTYGLQIKSNTSGEQFTIDESGKVESHSKLQALEHLSVFDSDNNETFKTFDGQIALSKVANMNNNNIVNVRNTGKTPVISASNYTIKKDGTDGTGIINFKTQ